MLKTSVRLIAAAIVSTCLLAWAAADAFHGPVHDLATTPADVTLIGANAGDVMGRGARGDFNGDGIDDLLLAAPNSTVAGKTFAGRAHVVFGSSGLTGTIDLSASAALTVLAADSIDQMGTRVAAGDFNGDGIDDLLLGAPGGDGAGNARQDSGEAYVIFGSLTLGGTIDLFTTAPGLTVIGADAFDNLGGGVAGGDFNGDGIDDLLIGAQAADAALNAKAGAGEAYVIFGSPALAGTIDLSVTAAGVAVLGADGGDALGRVATGDFNGDRIDDLLLSASGADATANAKLSAGEAYVILGSPTLTGSVDLAAAPAALTVIGADTQDTLGIAVGSGDVNGDGIDDLLVGAPAADGVLNNKTSAGEAYAIFGSRTLAGTVDLALSPAAVTVVGVDQLDTLGTSVGSGDFNGDGADDLLLGANGADGPFNGRSEAGEVYAVFGSPALSGVRNLATTPADRAVLGADINDLLGVQVASGDFNSDGIDDALMNASLADGVANARGDAGEAYVMFGACASGVDTDKDGLCDTFDLDDDNDGFVDAAEVPCGSDPLNAASTPERVGGAFAGVDDDGDTLIDEALPAGAETQDCDKDGFTGAVEAYVFSSATGDTSRDQTRCAATSAAGDENPDAWPPDNNDDQRITLTDVLRYIPVFNSFAPGPPYDSSFDLNASAGITLTDVLMFIPYMNKNCTP